MKTYAPGQIRNVALVGHGHSGKTSLAEAMLFAADAINRMGTTVDGNTVCDFDPEEHRRQISIALALAPVEWNGHKINVLDGPGYNDFLPDAEAAMRAADAAVIVVSGVDGLEVQARAMWEAAERLGLPRIVVVNKLDRERASFERTLEQLTEAFGARVAPLHVPIGSEHDFSGVVDLLVGKGYTYADGKRTEGAIPDEQTSLAEELRSRLLDSIVEVDEGLMERYLEGAAIETKELTAALGKAVLAGTAVPVLCTAATQAIGADLLCDFIVDAVPSPDQRPPITATVAGEETTLAPDPDGPLGALVFKTLSDPYVGRISYLRVFSGTLRSEATLHNQNKDVEERIGQLFTMRGKEHESVTEVPAGDIACLAKLAETVTGDTITHKNEQVEIPFLDLPDPVYRLAIEPKSKGDEEKMSVGLGRIAAEDRSFRWERNPETHQTIICGMGETHLEVVVEHLKAHHVEVETFLPRIAYRETIRGTAQAMGRHVKQSGGRGQYAVCHVEVSPLPRGGGYEYEDAIVGGAIPNSFIPSVDKGIQKVLEDGIVSGNKVVDVKVKCYDGKYHSVDSSDIAFQLAGAHAFKDACNAAGVVLLEPIMDLHVIIPDEFTGDIMGDLSSKRARIEGTEAIGSHLNAIHAKVPEAEVLRYAIDLRSKTHGQGTFRVEFSHYEDAPPHVQEKVVEEYEKARLESAK